MGVKMCKMCGENVSLGERYGCECNMVVNNYIRLITRVRVRYGECNKLEAHPLAHFPIDK